MHRRFARIGLSGLCVLLVFVLIGSIVYLRIRPISRSAISFPTSPQVSATVPWATIASPNYGTGNNELSAVARVDANNAWATGFYQDASTGFHRTLIERWNGEAWELVASPNSSNGNNFLAGISVVDAQNAWAVGGYRDISSDSDQALIERWNGTTWAIVPGPQPGSDSKFLFGVAALSTEDVWAVGKSQIGSSGAPHSFIEHWNGKSWMVVSSPNPGSFNNQLFGIAAVSATNIWAVGEFRNSPTKGNETLIEHWDGESWTVVPAPNPGDVNDVLAGISVVDAENIWAVGYYTNGSSSNTLIERWDGHSWVAVPGHNPGDGDNELFSVAAINANDVWVVGNFLTGSSSLQTLIEHWNGHTWSFENTPNPGNGSNSLDGIAILAADHFLAVGEAHQNASFQTLIMQRSNLP